MGATRSVQQGFSLIELLVALLVVVLLTSLVSLGVGGGGYGQKVNDEARFFVNSMALVQTEAELSGADHGMLLSLDLSEDHYSGEWLRRYDQGWSEPRGFDTEVQRFTFLPEVRVDLTLEGQAPIDFEADAKEMRPEELRRPQLVLFAGGEVTPGALDWVDRQTNELLYRVEWDLFGRFTMMPKGIPENDDE